MPKTPIFRSIKRAINLPRRDFLKHSISSALFAAPASQILLEQGVRAAVKTIAAPAPSGEPVVILGAGVAGLTTAYRLMKAGIACELYEASSRLGGRIFTKKNFNSDGQFCELGGEFMDSDQKEILALGKELGVETEDYHVLDAGVKEHQFFYKGKRYFDSDFAKAAAPVAKRLFRDMKAVFNNPKEPVLTYKHFKPSAVKFDRMTLAEYLDSMRNDTESWVIDAIGTAYLGEFGLDIGSQSAVNLMTLVDLEAKEGFPIFGASDESIRFKGGNSSLIEALAKALEGKVAVQLDRRLVKLESKSNGAIEMTFTSANGSRTETKTANQVVCTIPFPVLRGIEGIRTLGLSPVKLKVIDSLGYGVNSKNIVGFKRRNWRELAGVPKMSGYTFADLPSQTFWDMSRAQKGESGILMNFLGGTGALMPDVSKAENVLADIEKTFPGTKALHDGRYLHFGWCDYPFAQGSYACPCPGQYTTICGSPKEPELGGRLLFAGEHISETNQGYMNGAVETGNKAAQAIATLRGRRGLLKLRS